MSLLVQCLLWTAFCTIILWLLQVSECFSLTWSDLVIHNDHISITLCLTLLKRTITSYISPPQKHLSKSNEQLQQYVHHKATTSFVFFTGTNSPLSHAQLTTILHWLLSQTGLCPSLYTSHSFRIEAATIAAVAGLMWSLMKPLRSWNSNSYM